MCARADWGENENRACEENSSLPRKLAVSDHFAAGLLCIPESILMVVVSKRPPGFSLSRGRYRHRWRFLPNGIVLGSVQTLSWKDVPLKSSGTAKSLRLPAKYSASLSWLRCEGWGCRGLQRVCRSWTRLGLSFSHRIAASPL